MASVFGEQEDRYGWLREKLERRDKQGNLIKSSFGKKSPKPITPKMFKRTQEESKDINKFTRAELASTVKLMAQRANRRLKEIEEANLKKASNAYRWAERQAFDKTRFMRDSEAPRFRTDLRGANLATLREEMAQLRTFLFESTTSSVRGVKDKYERSYEEAKKYFGKAMKGVTFDEWAFFWSANNTKTLVDEYNSQVIEIIQELELSTLSKEELEEIIDKFVGLERSQRPSLLTMKQEIADEMEARKTRSLEEENEDGSLTSSLNLIP